MRVSTVREFRDKATAVLRSKDPRMGEARRRMGRRDPDDVHQLALALELGIPVWSNDKDFENAGVEWFTTEQF